MDRKGTLAIDLGNSTTVVAFQGEKDENPQLLDLPPISRSKGEVPSLVFASEKHEPKVLIGQQVLDSVLSKEVTPNIYSDFKRWIGANTLPKTENSRLLPEQAGELLIQGIWDRIPSNLKIKRLVLTAPVETYRAYRTWLNNVCETLRVDEIALVDEPTAAALGAGVPSGSKLLVIDIGGSTIDFSLVALEGGEGKAEPVAQLIRFGGNNLEGKSKQRLRCAKVLGKGGMRLGGRDFDRWIVNHLYPNHPITESLLNTAEKLKCRLSDLSIEKEEVLRERVPSASKNDIQELQMSRFQLEKLLIDRGLLKSLKTLLSQTLLLGEVNGCNPEDLYGAVFVGGGARIPFLQSWLKEQSKPAPLLTPPPIEAVAKGALHLTPGVTIKDVLKRGASLRCWDKKSRKHIWHPLFVAGQPWPTVKDLSLVISASKTNQVEIDLVIAEPQIQGSHDVIYVDGIPTITEESEETQPSILKENIQSIILNKPGKVGEDCLQLLFSIDSDCTLKVQAIDIRSNEDLGSLTLGLIN